MSERCKEMSPARLTGKPRRCQHTRYHDTHRWTTTQPDGSVRVYKWRTKPWPWRALTGNEGPDADVVVGRPERPGSQEGEPGGRE